MDLIDNGKSSWFSGSPYPPEFTLNDNLVLSLFMTYHRLYNKRNMTGSTSGARTDYLSGVHELTPLFSSILWCLQRLGHKMMFSSSIFSFVCRGFMSYLCYLYLFAVSKKLLCPTWFPYHMMFVLFSDNTTGVISRVGTHYHWLALEFTLGFYLGSCYSV